MTLDSIATALLSRVLGSRQNQVSCISTGGSNITDVCLSPHKFNVEPASYIVCGCLWKGFSFCTTPNHVRLHAMIFFVISCVDGLDKTLAFCELTRYPFYAPCDLGWLPAIAGGIFGMYSIAREAGALGLPRDIKRWDSLFHQKLTRRVDVVSCVFEPVLFVF